MPVCAWLFVSTFGPVMDWYTPLVAFILHLKIRAFIKNGQDQNYQTGLVKTLFFTFSLPGKLCYDPSC